MSNRFETLIFSKFKNGFPKVNKSGELYDWQNGERIIMSDPKEYLVITPPEGEDFQFCSIKIQTKENLIVEYSVNKSHWKIHFPDSNDTGADSPVTVNVTVAPPEGN